MNNKIYFLRHGHSVIQEDRPASSWPLSEEGKDQAESAKTAMGVVFDVVISSNERKAIQTAEVFLAGTPLNLSTDSLFNELDRDRGPFLSKEEYSQSVEKAMANPMVGIHHWEPTQSALARFTKGVEWIEETHTSKHILLVSHGIVLSLYFATLLGIGSSVFSRWRKLRPCSWGIVENQLVVRDIVI